MNIRFGMFDDLRPKILWRGVPSVLRSVETCRSGIHARILNDVCGLRPRNISSLAG